MGKGSDNLKKGAQCGVCWKGSKAGFSLRIWPRGSVLSASSLEPARIRYLKLPEIKIQVWVPHALVGEELTTQHYPMCEAHVQTDL